MDEERLLGYQSGWGTLRYQQGSTMLLPQSESQHSQKAKAHLCSSWHEAVKVYICSGKSHHCPGAARLQDLCLCARSRHKEESGASWEGIQSICVLPGPAKRAPQSAQCPRWSLGNSLLHAVPMGLGLGESQTLSVVLGGKSSVEIVVTG